MPDRNVFRMKGLYNAEILANSLPKHPKKYEDNRDAQDYWRSLVDPSFLRAPMLPICKSSTDLIHMHKQKTYTLHENF